MALAAGCSSKVRRFTKVRRHMLPILHPSMHYHLYLVRVLTATFERATIEDDLNHHTVNILRYSAPIRKLFCRQDWIIRSVTVWISTRGFCNSFLRSRSRSALRGWLGCANAKLAKSRYWNWRIVFAIGVSYEAVRSLEVCEVQATFWFSLEARTLIWTAAIGNMR